MGSESTLVTLVNGGPEVYLSGIKGGKVPRGESEWSKVDAKLILAACPRHVSKQKKSSLKPSKPTD